MIENKQLKSSHKIFDKDKLLSYDLIIPSNHKPNEEEKFGNMKQRRKTIQVKKEKVRLARREDYDNDDLLDENLLCSRRNSSIHHASANYNHDSKEVTSSHNVFPVSYLNRNISPNLKSLENIAPIVSA